MRLDKLEKELTGNQQLHHIKSIEKKEVFGIENWTG
jgi:hypothetical protein